MLSTHTCCCSIYRESVYENKKDVSSDEQDVVAVVVEDEFVV